MERGRPQRPLSDAAGPVRDLAAALRALRAAAGNPPYRTMAGTAHFSPATLARAAAGHRLPSLDVVLAYAAACGGDREEWEQRWRACAEQVTRGQVDDPPADAEPIHPADVQPNGREGTTPPDHSAPTPRRPDLRRSAVVPAVSLLAMAVLLLGTSAASEAPSKPDPHELRMPTVAATEPLGRACAPEGIVVPSPTSALAPQAQQAQIRADFETGFDTDRDGWAWWWPAGYKPLPGDFTTDQAFHGTRSLRVRVPAGVTAAVGTIHLAGLKPASTVTAHIWYGGQGAGRICPFIQTPGAGAIEWIPQPDLELTPADWPRWYTCSWTVPDSPIFGTGIGLINSGATDFVILLDAVSW